MPENQLINITKEPEHALRLIEVIAGTLKVGDGTPPQQASGAMVVATQMVAEGITLADLRSKYHVYPDKLDLRSEWVHAELERRGWAWTWTNDGEDGKKATLSAVKNGVAHDVSFTIDMAKKKGLVKQRSTWDVDPALMLRARAITRFATMWEPSIGSGGIEDSEATGLRESVITGADVKVESVESEVLEIDEDGKVTEVFTIHTPLAKLDLPKRAYDSFALPPQITTIGDVCEHSHAELCLRDKLGKGTVDKIEQAINLAGFELKQVSEVGLSDDGGIGKSDLEMLANAGIKGSIAGTALRRDCTDDFATASDETVYEDDQIADIELRGEGIATLRSIAGQSEELTNLCQRHWADAYDKNSIEDLTTKEVWQSCLLVAVKQSGAPQEAFKRSLQGKGYEALPLVPALDAKEFYERIVKNL